MMVLLLSLALTKTAGRKSPSKNVDVVVVGVSAKSPENDASGDKDIKIVGVGNVVDGERTWWRLVSIVGDIVEVTAVASDEALFNKNDDFDALVVAVVAITVGLVGGWAIEVYAGGKYNVDIGVVVVTSCWGNIVCVNGGFLATQYSVFC